MLDNINSVCTWLFVLEMLVMWTALGLRQYFSVGTRAASSATCADLCGAAVAAAALRAVQEGWNIFDSVVVAVSVIDFVASSVYGTAGVGVKPLVFRAIRVLRVFRIVRRFPGLARVGRTLL